MQQVEDHRQDHQQEDGEQLLAEGDVEDRPAVDEIFAQDLDRLQRCAGTEDDRHENSRLQRVEHQGVDIQFRDVAENLVAERLPVRERISQMPTSDANQKTTLLKWMNGMCATR